MQIGSISSLLVKGALAMIAAGAVWWYYDPYGFWNNPLFTAVQSLHLPGRSYR